ncbi:MAG: digeranylgeranylglycerophospholipid reductase [Pyrodictiaceae archaeon]
MSEERFDVIIAGLGPAGTVALYHLARLGFKVVGFDQRSFNDLWGKPCGDAIGAHHFDAAKVPLPSSVIRNNVKGIDIFSPGEKVRYRVLGEGYIIDRRRLGQELVKYAIDKGATVLFSAKVLAPIIENGRVVGVEVLVGDSRKRYYSKVVIEATGFPRALKSKLPRNWHVAEPIRPEDTNIAYRKIIEYVDYEVEEPEIIRIYLDQSVAPGGYWWFFPESSRRVNTGLGVQGGKGYGNPMSIFEKKLTRHRLFKMEYKVLEAAGAPVPTRRPANTLVGPGILVLGDAGYTVNPLHGGGMGYAFYSGFAAAQAFEEAYNRGDFSEKGLWRLNTLYMKGIGAKQAALDVFRRFLQRLDNSEIAYGMEKRLIPEVDVYEVSSTGELKVSVIEKALIMLRGLRRPSLLFKLKLVADYMSKARALYKSYPESPEGLTTWIRKVDNLFREFEARLVG